MTEREGRKREIESDWKRRKKNRRPDRKTERNEIVKETKWDGKRKT